MLDQTVIDQYLEEVDGYLHLDRARRGRVLDEIEGHLHDAVDAHLAEGAQPMEAMRRAIADMGPAVDVAMQFSTAMPPSRSVRGWRRWTPMVLPAGVLTMGVALSVWTLAMLRDGLTYGLRRALWLTLLPTTVVGALTIATYVAIGKGDRDPAWRRAAWLFAVLTGVVVFLSVSL